jgi:hypothetical protein
MLSYLKDTNAVEVYDGANWVASDDPNAIQNTIVDAKGDLISATAADTPARLAVGNNGETLVANSAAATGLSYKEDYAAGKNKIINGDFGIWQRGTSFAGNVYTADRWVTQTNKTLTVSRQAFTAGTAPVAGYEGTFFLRQAYSADGSFGALQTKLEDVRLFAGETITVSYWAKADATVSNTPSVLQNFGSGGSANAGVNGTTHDITTSWTRFSSVYTLASISGKTIGAGNFLLIQPILIENATAHTIDIWGVQVEAGSVATAFQTATGTLQGELAACQRYYWRNTNTGSSSQNYTQGLSISTSAVYFGVQFPVTMRATPSSIDYSAVSVSSASTGYSGGTTAAVANQSSPSAATLSYTHGSATLTSDRAYLVQIGASTGYIAFNSEL